MGVAHFPGVTTRKLVSLATSGAITALGVGLPWKYATVPSWIGNGLTYGGGSLLLAVITWIVGGWVAKQIPARPWLPDRQWQIRAWLVRRPAVAVLMVVPAIRWEDERLEECRLVLTIHQAIDHAGADVSVLYETALLTIKQTAAGRRQRFTFRPLDVGGMLTLPIRRTDLNRAFQCTFVWTGLPARIDRAPDLQPGLIGPSVKSGRSSTVNPRCRGACLQSEATNLAPPTWPRFRDRWLHRKVRLSRFDRSNSGFVRWHQNIRGITRPVSAAHFYRHAPGTPDPTPPSLQLAIAMFISGAGHLRWFSEKVPS